MTREQAREHVNSLLTVELKPAKRKSTYICLFCGNGSGKKGDGISTKDGKRYKCFRCGFYGDYLDILKQKDGVTEGDIFRRYSIFVETKQDLPNSTNQNTNYNEPMDYCLQVSQVLQKSPEALRYLQNRGISMETARCFNLGYDPHWRSPAAVKGNKNPPSSRRIIIPTGTKGYTARSIDMDTPERYRFMKEGKAGYFGIEAIYGSVPVFIVEAAFDALSVYEAGGVACAIGSVSGVDKFLDILARERPTAPLILSLDNDKAGQDAQKKLAARLTALKIDFCEINVSGEYKDPNEHLQADRAAFTALIHSDPAKRAKKTYFETAASFHVKSLMGAIAESANTAAVPTGFTQLDKALDGGLYEGLYIMGAISSLGKTTFMLQIADQIAQHGRDVLIFSLEMSRHELMAKSISRLTLKNCDGNLLNAKTTRGILNGSKWAYFNLDERDLINRSIAEYEEYSKHIFIHEGVGSIGVEQIKEEVTRHMSFTGNGPVVIIDYLQIITPVDSRATDKQNTDKTVLELKRLSRDRNIPVVAISSFNRDNYTSPVNLASFKESGAIEYSSDVLLGLQLSGMDDLSQSETKRGETIRQIEEMKKADPRKAQLKILKNRNGRIGVSLYYDYYSVFNTFTETE